jgi:K+-sensing histidine kinase KdpD
MFVWRRVGPVIASFITLALVTAVLVLSATVFAVDHLIFGYLVPISFIAIRYGSASGMLASLVSAFAAAFLLYPPILAITIANPLHLGELTFFCLLAMATSQIVGRLGHDQRDHKRNMVTS